MVAAMTCQASLKIGQTKPASTSSVPLQQPLGFTRPQTATFATSGALAYGNGLLSATVRKANAKLEEIDSDDLFASLIGKREQSKSGQPVFRSALEQVSYQTNSSLSQDSGKSARRQTVLGRVGRLFGR